MRSRAELAFMLRSVQWAADEGAFNIGADRYTIEQQGALADHLTAVASALRDDIASRHIEGSSTARELPGP